VKTSVIFSVPELRTENSGISPHAAVVWEGSTGDNLLTPYPDPISIFGQIMARYGTRAADLFYLSPSLDCLIDWEKLLPMTEQARENDPGDAVQPTAQPPTSASVFDLSDSAIAACLGQLRAALRMSQIRYGRWLVGLMILSVAVNVAAYIVATQPVAHVPRLPAGGRMAILLVPVMLVYLFMSLYLLHRLSTRRMRSPQLRSFSSTVFEPFLSARSQWLRDLILEGERLVGEERE
jgi:hypothetical protein